MEILSKTTIGTVLTVLTQVIMGVNPNQTMGGGGGGGDSDTFSFFKMFGSIFQTQDIGPEGHPRTSPTSMTSKQEKKGHFNEPFNIMSPSPLPKCVGWHPGGGMSPLSFLY